MNSLLFLFCVLVILNWSYYLYRILITLKRFPPPKRLQPEFQEELPSVSILIPARNEERNIKRCIESLLALDYPHYEIVAIDDRSTDNTASILRGLEQQTSLLKVVTVEESQPGWSGKNYALHVGMDHAKGTWFLFSDADTEHYPLSLRLGIQEAREHAVGFLSFFSKLECRGFWDALIQPMASGLVTLWYPMEKVNAPSLPVAFANGQYLLMRRDAYRDIGGHLTVKACLMEDVALAEEAKRRGIPIRIAIGTHVLKTRMYCGFKESWNGWKRNSMLLTHRRASALIRSALGLAWIGIFPFFAFAGALMVEAPAGTRLLAGLAFCVSAAVGWIFSILSRQPQWPPLLVPLSSLVVLSILLNAAWDILAGRQTSWRGIRYEPSLRGREDE